MKFGESRFTALSEIFRDIAQVLFASVLIEPLITHSTRWFIVAIGIFLSLVFWVSSLFLMKEQSYD